MADNNTSTPQQKFLTNNKMDMKTNNKHVNVIHRTTSESLRIGGDNINSSDKNLINHPPSTSLSNATLTNSITRKPKNSSFQITSVTVGTRMSADNGDDSADDLDESHTDDNSRITDLENETPSFSEDTFSKEDVFFSSNPIGTAPVIPTSSQYGLAIVAPPDLTGHHGPIDMHVSVTDAGNIVNIVGNSSKHDVDFKDLNHRNERFKVVKIESTEPFKRGRWMCMDYLDHTTLQQNNVKEGEGSTTGGLTNDSGVVLTENNIDDSTTTPSTATGTNTLNTDINSLPAASSPGQSLHQQAATSTTTTTTTGQNQSDCSSDGNVTTANHTQSMVNVPINSNNNNNNSNSSNNVVNNVTPQTMPQSHLQQIIAQSSNNDTIAAQSPNNQSQTQTTVPTSQVQQSQGPIQENNQQQSQQQQQQQQQTQYYTTQQQQQGSNQQQPQQPHHHHVQGATLPANIIHGIGLNNTNNNNNNNSLPSQSNLNNNNNSNNNNQNQNNVGGNSQQQHHQSMSMVNLNVHDNSYQMQQHSQQPQEQQQQQQSQQQQQQQQQPPPQQQQQPSQQQQQQQSSIQSQQSMTQGGNESSSTVEQNVSDSMNYPRQQQANHPLIAQQSIQEMNSQPIDNQQQQQQNVTTINQQEQNSNTGTSQQSNSGGVPEYTPTLSTQSSTASNASNASTIICNNDNATNITTNNIETGDGGNVATGGSVSGNGGSNGNGIVDTIIQQTITSKNDDTTSMLTGGLNFINQGQLAQLQQHTLAASITTEDGQPTEDSESFTGLALALSASGGPNKNNNNNNINQQTTTGNHLHHHHRHHHHHTGHHHNNNNNTNNTITTNNSNHNNHNQNNNNNNINNTEHRKNSFEQQNKKLLSDVNFISNKNNVFTNIALGNCIQNLMNNKSIEPNCLLNPSSSSSSLLSSSSSTTSSSEKKLEQQQQQEKISTKSDLELPNKSVKNLIKEGGGDTQTTSSGRSSPSNHLNECTTCNITGTTNTTSSSSSSTTPTQGQLGSLGGNSNRVSRGASPQHVPSTTAGNGANGGGENTSASGTSAVAIDNKIEQAMDLVKSHLMFAVREEVEVLKEKIAELMDRINQLEIENTILKANASQETLSQLSASVASTKVPPANPTSGSVS